NGKEAPEMDSFILAATSTSSKGNPYLFPIIILALFGLLYFVMIRPQRNRQRQAQQTQSEVMPGSRVRTTAGMYATVVSVGGDAGRWAHRHENRRTGEKWLPQAVTPHGRAGRWPCWSRSLWCCCWPSWAAIWPAPGAGPRTSGCTWAWT